MASAVVGTRDAGILTDARLITKDAIDDILKYYHYKPVDIPERISECCAGSLGYPDYRELRASLEEWFHAS